MKVLSKIGLCALLLLASSAQAVILSFDPSFQSAQPSDTIVLNLIAELESTDKALSAYDFDIAFDTQALNFSGVTFGGSLGQSFQSVNESNGIIDIAESSLLTNSNDLLSLQSNRSLTLARFTFVVSTLLENANTLISFVTNDPFFFLVDSSSAPATITQINNGEIRNATPLSHVAESSIVTLTLLGLTSLVTIRRFKRQSGAQPQ